MTSLQDDCQPGPPEISSPKEDHPLAIVCGYILTETFQEIVFKMYCLKKMGKEAWYTVTASSIYVLLF